MFTLFVIASVVALFTLAPAVCLKLMLDRSWNPAVEARRAQLGNSLRSAGSEFPRFAETMS